jgi:hypothetical protein
MTGKIAEQAKVKRLLALFQIKRLLLLHTQ